MLENRVASTLGVSRGKVEINEEKKKGNHINCVIQQLYFIDPRKSIRSESPLHRAKDDYGMADFFVASQSDPSSEDAEFPGPCSWMDEENSTVAASFRRPLPQWLQQDWCEFALAKREERADRDRSDAYRRGIRLSAE